MFWEDFSQRMGWPRLLVAVFSQRLLVDPHLPANFRPFAPYLQKLRVEMEDVNARDRNGVFTP